MIVSHGDVGRTGRRAAGRSLRVHPRNPCFGRRRYVECQAVAGKCRDTGRGQRCRVGLAAECARTPGKGDGQRVAGTAIGEPFLLEDALAQLQDLRGLEDEPSSLPRKNPIFVLSQLNK